MFESKFEKSIEWPTVQYCRSMNMLFSCKHPGVDLFWKIYEWGGCNSNVSGWHCYLDASQFHWTDGTGQTKCSSICSRNGIKQINAKNIFSFHGKL